MNFSFMVLCYSPFAPDDISLEVVRTSIKKSAFSLLSHFFTDVAFMKSFLCLDPNGNI